MDGVEVAAGDPRVRAILTEPDAYFSAAIRRAWPQACADVELELRSRARDPRNGARDLRSPRIFTPGKWRRGYGSPLAGAPAICWRITMVDNRCGTDSGVSRPAPADVGYTGMRV